MDKRNLLISGAVSVLVTVAVIVAYNFFGTGNLDIGGERRVWILPDFNSISQVAEFEVTAYDAHSSQSINVEKWRDGKTALNRPAVPGRTIAVDPKIIPFDSLVYVPGMGWRVAEDVGGAIKGYRIDILLRTKGLAMTFGRKKMHILWVPPATKDVVAQKAKKRTTPNPKKRTVKKGK